MGVGNRTRNNGGKPLRVRSPQAAIANDNHDSGAAKGNPLPPGWSAASDTTNVTNDWVKSFKDADLEVMVREAIANNLDLRQSAARVEAARQSVIVVGSKLKPQIGATIGGATTHSSNDASSNEYQSSQAYAEFSWEIDVWGRIRAQRAASQENYEAILLDYAFARQSLAAITAKSWFLAIETRRLLALAKQSVDIYTNLLNLVKVRRAAGRVADLDVAEASYELNEAQSQLILMQGLYSEARRTLEVRSDAILHPNLRWENNMILCRLRSHRDCRHRCLSGDPTLLAQNTRCGWRSGRRKLRSWRCFRVFR